MLYGHDCIYRCHSGHPFRSWYRRWQPAHAMADTCSKYGIHSSQANQSRILYRFRLSCCPHQSREESRAVFAHYSRCIMWMYCSYLLIQNKCVLGCILDTQSIWVFTGNIRNSRIYSKMRKEKPGRLTVRLAPLFLFIRHVSFKNQRCSNRIHCFFPFFSVIIMFR